MKRSKRIVLLSHCILNCNSKVEGCNDFKDTAKNLVSYLMEKDFGIIQLPCPETTMYGIKRWGHVKEQFDTYNFRKNCRSIFHNILEQIEDYTKNGYEIKALIGINGSPSCGVEKTCSSKVWGGELSHIENFDLIKNAVEYIDGQGVFIDEINKILKERGFDIPVIGIYEKNENSINDIKVILEK